MPTPPPQPAKPDLPPGVKLVRKRALDYSMALQAATGHPQVRIRAGIHIGG